MGFLTILFVNEGEITSSTSLSIQINGQQSWDKTCDNNLCYCKEKYARKIQRAWRKYHKIIKLRKRAFSYLKERQYKKARLR